MKTYSEHCGKPKIDWNDFLARAIKGTVTREEKRTAKIRAGDWVTCACGNQCDALPRYLDGCPRDEELIMMGTNFYDYVDEGEWKQAKDVLKQIEIRSGELLHEIARIPAITNPIRERPYRA